MASTAKHDWPMVRLGDVCSINPITKFGPSADDTEIDFVPMDAVSVEGKLDYTEKRTVDEVKSGYSRFYQGDVLLAKITPCFENGKSAIAGIDTSVGAGSTEFHIFRPPKDLDSRYLHYFLRTPALRAIGEANMRGSSGHRRVPGWVFENAKIPLPPLVEQRRIAAILDEVNRIQALVGGCEALVRQFEESIFRGFAQNAPTSSLEDLSVAVIDCPHSTPEWAEEGEICLWTGNLGVGSLKWDKRRYVSSKTFEERTKRAELVEGDIVLSREGTVGIAAKIPAGLRACMGQRLVQVRPDLEKTSSNWLLQSILYSLDPNRIGMLMVGATSKHLNVKDLRKLKVPVLGPAELSRFETQIEMTDKLRQLLSKRFELIAELQKSLSIRAFQGEL